MAMQKSPKNYWKTISNEWWALADIKTCKRVTIIKNVLLVNE